MVKINIEDILPQGLKPPAYIDVQKLMELILTDYEKALQTVLGTGRALRDYKEQVFKQRIELISNMTYEEAQRYIEVADRLFLNKGDLFYIVTGCFWDRFPSRYDKGFRGSRV